MRAQKCIALLVPLILAIIALSGAPTAATADERAEGSATGVRSEPPAWTLEDDAGSGDEVGPAHHVAVEGVVGESQRTSFVTGGATLTVLPAAGPTPPAGELGALRANIACQLNVQNVHGSSHVAGTINGVARINCNGPAGSLQIHYSLIRLSPYTQWAGPSRTNAGYTFIHTNRAVPCSQATGNFRGWAQGIIAPPPGYTLVGPAIANAYGNITRPTCGNQPTGAPEDVYGVGETLTVTFVRSDLVD